MQNVWNWLMRADAKSLFLVALLALLATVGWRGYVEYDAWHDTQAAATAVKAPPELPEFAPHRGFGILEYVAEQARPDGRALPVDLFRPTLDAMVSNLVNAILHDPALVVDTAPPEAPRPTLPPGEENLFELVQRPDGQWVRQTRQRPAPEIGYDGVFQRTDGRTAAWITERNSRTRRFYEEGEELFGGRLVRVTPTDIAVRLPDGAEHTVPRGGTLTFPAPPPVEEIVRVSAEGARPRRPGGRGGDDGAAGRGVPSEAQLAALARTNPELAQRVRDAIRQRQQQDRQRGDNP